jgi:hypothetical protein
MQVPAWMWPHTQKAQPTFSVRLGRVLHWTTTGYAALAVLAMVTVIIFVVAGVDGYQLDFDFWTLPFLSAAAFMFGRGVRFILAGE